jgi:hypothetical protein
MKQTSLNRLQAARKAENNSNNMPGKCQAWTRGIYGAPAVGDQDRDGDSDAIDGWKSEPSEYRHQGDTRPPRGVPLAWAGGDFGHRAISLGDQKVRSIDINGDVGTVDIRWFTRNWGYRYLGWSETISGIYIPKAPVIVVPVRKSNQQIAREVIAGKWGTGAERIARLKKAGYDPAKIQSIVNSMLK